MLEPRVLSITITQPERGNLRARIVWIDESGGRQHTEGDALRDDVRRLLRYGNDQGVKHQWARLLSAHVGTLRWPKKGRR